MLKASKVAWARDREKAPNDSHYDQQFDQRKTQRETPLTTLYMRYHLGLHLSIVNRRRTRRPLAAGHQGRFRRIEAPTFRQLARR